MRPVRNFLTTMFVIAISTATAQTNWETIELDRNVIAKLPSNFILSDESGKTTYRASIGEEYFVVERAPQEYAQIVSKDGLFAFYEEYQRRIISAHEGRFIGQQRQQAEDLHISSFDFLTGTGDKVRLNASMVIFLNGSVYSFTRSCLRNAAGQRFKNKEIFFNGIQLLNSDFEDQLTTLNDNERLGELMGLVARYIAVGAVVLFAFLLAAKRYKAAAILKSLMAWAFLGLGTFSFLTFIANWFFGVMHYTILIGGLVMLAIGFGLRIIRLPSVPTSMTNN